MIEEFKKIEEFPKYEVSNLGRVRNKNTGKILKPRKSNSGYFYVSFYKDGKEHNRFIHRLVAKTFISNPNNYPEVNHINEDKEDNCIDNLEWCTRIYNVNYGTRNIRSAVNRGLSVEQYSLDGKLIATFSSIKEAARKSNITFTSIQRCCYNIYSQAGGYIWRFAD